MSQMHGIRCNTTACSAHILWITERGDRAPTKAAMEQHARNEGWHAPDRLGNHYCPAHRREDGRRSAEGARRGR